MYDFVDRPVALLGPGGRFLLAAMRGWIQAATLRRCPPGALAPAFARHGVLPALAPVHQLMTALNRQGRQTIAFAPPACARISEGEAVLLQLWRDAAQAPERAERTLELLVEAEAVGPALMAMVMTVCRLWEGGLAPVEPIRATSGG